VPARIGVLGRVADHVGKHLGESWRITIHEQRLRRDLEVEAMAFQLEQRASDLDGAGDRSSHIDDLALQLELAARDARDVEQIVDESGQVMDLALDHLKLAGRLLIRT
jgi:hypothetical protein